MDDGDSRISDTIPLVINTMGWTKGLGADLNTKIEELVEPTDVFELGRSAPESSPWTIPVPSSDSWKEAEKTVHSLSAIAPTILSTRYTPAECRALSTLSYFHAKTLSCEATHSHPRWETIVPLCAQPPYEIDIKTAFDQVILAVNGMEDIVRSEIDRVLNGAIVAFVEENNFSNDGEKLLPADVPYAQGSSPPSPLNSNCIGLGLIRSISPAKMHIITPVPPYLLARCRVLVKGEVELPVWGMLDFRSENDESVAGVERSKTPYMKWGKGEELGGEKRRVRRNLMRRGQL
jgi:polynucleotide 5'-hydroxyl-kinase GRC3/NOL9